MNRVKRRALKAINRKLAKVAKKLRAQEPEWEPGAVRDKDLVEYKRRKRDAMYSELMQITGKTEFEISYDVAEVLEEWDVAQIPGMGDVALSHLLKLAKRGDWG